MDRPTTRRIARKTQHAAELLDALVRLDLPAAGTPATVEHEAMDERRGGRSWERAASEAPTEATPAT